jgi:hypothetical protein
MFKTYFSISIFLFFGYGSIAQSKFCGMSSQLNIQGKQATIDDKQELQLNQAAHQYIKQNTETNRTTVEIPIVFHIIHEGGPENIADSILINEVNVLNQRYSNTGIYNYVDGVNTNIQFCLASVDP